MFNTCLGPESTLLGFDPSPLLLHTQSSYFSCSKIFSIIIMFFIVNLLSIVILRFEKTDSRILFKSIFPPQENVTIFQSDPPEWKMEDEVNLLPFFIHSKMLTQITKHKTRCLRKIIQSNWTQWLDYGALWWVRKQLSVFHVNHKSSDSAGPDDDSSGSVRGWISARFPGDKEFSIFHFGQLGKCSWESLILRKFYFRSSVSRCVKLCCVTKCFRQEAEFFHRDFTN